MTTHKYRPDDFVNILGLGDELKEFYYLYEAHQRKKSQYSKIDLEIQGRNLFFTLKHRKVEGTINPIIADEILEYAEELLSNVN